MNWFYTTVVGVLVVVVDAADRVVAALSDIVVLIHLKIVLSVRTAVGQVVTLAPVSLVIHALGRLSASMVLVYLDRLPDRIIYLSHFTLAYVVSVVPLSRDGRGVLQLDGFHGSIIV